ncbi:MAG: hypothetical protein RJS97_22995 [Parvibaculaceae bacterium]
MSDSIRLRTDYRFLLQQWEKHTNAMLVSILGEEQVAKGMNAAAAVQLRMQAEFREAIEKQLAALYLPSSSDFERVCSQISVLEDKIDNLTQMLERQGRTLPASDRNLPRTRTPKKPG